MLFAFLLIFTLQSGAFNEGQQLLTAGKMQEALAAFDKAAAAEPNRGDVQLGRCRALAGLRKFDDALAACDRSLQLDPKNAAAWRDRGHYKLNLGRTADARQDLERAEALDNTDRSIFYHLGLARYLNADWPQAAEQFQGCLKNSKEKADQIECEAWLYPSLVRAGQKEEAQKLLDGIEPDPSITGHPAWYFDRLLLFKGLKTEDQMAANLNVEGALSLESIGYSIGLWHLLNGRNDKAREYYQKVLTGDLPFAWGYRAAQLELPRISSGASASLDAENRVFKVGNGVSAPEAVSAPQPSYTEGARKEKFQGVVILRCIVNQSGEVTGIKVVRSLRPDLDKEALTKVKTWKFQPAMKDGKPVTVEVNIEVNFRLY